ncbi:MAG: YbaK/EbsC family protein [Pseudonocardiaceae bacterium]
MSTLVTLPVSNRTDLIAEPVALALKDWPYAGDVRVAEIDPEFADTAQFCARYDEPLSNSANCVVVAGKRGGELRYAACLVLATTRADINGRVRRHIDARKVSFAPMDTAVELTGMEYGGITPIGLPADWPVLIDRRVQQQPYVIVGSGLRHSKISIPGAVLGELPGAEMLDNLAMAAG